jgi:hypothetical protein
MLSILKWIGFDTEAEITEELEADTHTSAKAFHYMYSHRFNVRELPWTSETTAEPDEKLMMPPMTIDPEQTAEEPRAPMTIASPDVQSLKRSALPRHAFEAEKAFEETVSDLPWTQEELMGIVQRMLTEKEYQWFHPHDLEIVAAAPGRAFYLVFQAENIELEVAGLIIKAYDAAREVVQEWVKAVREAVVEPDVVEILQPEESE